MRLLWHRTTTKVLGDAHANNEDVISPKTRKGEIIRRFAMCDGATSSFAARDWANMLACAFSADGDAGAKERVYSAARTYEAQFPAAALAGMGHNEIEAFKRGSSATLLLLEQPNPGEDIRVTAVGDSCFFLVDGENNVVDSFPLKEAAQFSTSAYLVTVTFEGLKALFADGTRAFYWNAKTFSHEEIGDKMILCATDAISQWIVAHKSSPKDIGRLINAVRSPNKKKFKGFVGYERTMRRMAVDDSTVAILGM